MKFSEIIPGQFANFNMGEEMYMLVCRILALFLIQQVVIDLFIYFYKSIPKKNVARQFGRQFLDKI